MGSTLLTICSCLSSMVLIKVFPPPAEYIVTNLFLHLHLLPANVIHVLPALHRFVLQHGCLRRSNKPCVHTSQADCDSTAATKYTRKSKTRAADFIFVFDINCLQNEIKWSECIMRAIMCICPDFIKKYLRLCCNNMACDIEF